MNNFTNQNDIYAETQNDYCIAGLDNNYNETINDTAVSCINGFNTYFNE